MRFYEIAAPARSVVATERFVDEYIKAAKLNPEIVQMMHDFLDFRETARPDAAYGKKDYAFSHGDLKGWRHCHLIFGKLILIYKVDASTIWLASLTDHTSYDGKNPKIGAYIKRLGADSFHDEQKLFSPTTSETASVTPAQKQDLCDLIYDLSQGETRREVESLARGDVTPNLREYLSLLDLSEHQLVSAFGSQDDMIAFAKRVLRDTAIKESRRRRA